MTPHPLSLRGENASDRRGNPSCLEGMRTTCLFAYWFTVDRHGLAALAMTRWGGSDVSGSVTSRSLSLRGGSGGRNGSEHNLSLRGGHASDRRGNPSCLGGEGRVCLFAYWITVDRHGLSALAMTRLGNKGCTAPSGS